MLYAFLRCQTTIKPYLASLNEQYGTFQGVHTTLGA